MSNELDSYQEDLLCDFLADNWEIFTALCTKRGFDAEEIYLKLGGEPEK